MTDAPLDRLRAEAEAFADAHPTFSSAQLLATPVGARMAAAYGIDPTLRAIDEAARSRRAREMDARVRRRVRR